MIKRNRYIWDAETTGLEPMDSRIVCVSIIDLQTDEVKTFIDADEKKVLTEFWERVKGSIELIGFNSDGFDMPFIIKRSLINKVKTNPDVKSTDIRKSVNGFWFSYNKFGKGTLMDWAKVLGIPVESEAGNAVPLLFAENKLDEIEKHCVEDVMITKKLLELAEYCNVMRGK